MTSSNESVSQSPKTKPQLTRLQGVKGMNDILPPDSQDWEWFEGRVRHWMGCYGYRPIRTPIVEPTALYVRGLGEVTDIVEKEMYSFEDRLNGENLTLRPEGTAGVVRSVIEHNLLYEGGKRLYYIGPMFRHERPQRGRYRQFHQVGVEALGFAGPEVDAEVILLAHALWQDLGLTDVRLELNCLGELPERQAHRAALIAYLEQHKDVLDADAQRRLYSNPLRILDTKNPAMQEMVNQAPQLLDFLSPASRSHFDAVCKILEASGVAYRINPRLVRGMDYYNLTVFEFVTQSLGAQGTLCGGGRYNDLIACMGGQPAPAVGWGMGIERVLDLLKTLDRIPPASDWDVYAIVPDEATLPLAVSVCQQLRQLGVRIQLHSRAELGSGMGSMKSQFKKADASGARHALIFGADEVAQGQVTVKALRDGQGAQRLEPLAQVALWACSLQSPPSANR